MANLGIQIKGVRSLVKWNIFLFTKSLELERGESIILSKIQKTKLGEKKRI